ncbi:hypothetical protein ILYODFUR_010125 [Ilyodon furcidens]|uniref:Secreted protein n=1 Tax=Ilyodon furcidens TaxID=33524 RepID=A0ABV0VDB6_9TELE
MQTPWGTEAWLRAHGVLLFCSCPVLFGMDRRCGKSLGVSELSPVGGVLFARGLWPHPRVVGSRQVAYGSQGCVGLAKQKKKNSWINVCVLAHVWEIVDFCRP